MTWLLRLEKLATLVYSRKLGVHLGVHVRGVILTQLSLHVGVDHAGPDRHRRDVGLLATQGQDEVVHSGFSRAVQTPATVARHRGTGRGEDYFPLGLAESGHSCFGLLFVSDELLVEVDTDKASHAQKQPS